MGRRDFVTPSGLKVLASSYTSSEITPAWSYSISALLQHPKGGSLGFSLGFCCHGWGHRFCMYFFLWKHENNYCLKVFCFGRLPFSWSVRVKAGLYWRCFFYTPVSPGLSTSSAPGLEYIGQKKSPETLPSCCSLCPNNTGVCFLHSSFQRIIIVCFIYNIQGFWSYLAIEIKKHMSILPSWNW